MPGLVSALYLNRGYAHIKLNNLSAAIADCSRVIDSGGSVSGEDANRIVAMAYWNRSQCHRLAGDLQQAEKDAIEVHSRLPDLNPDTNTS